MSDVLSLLSRLNSEIILVGTHVILDGVMMMYDSFLVVDVKSVKSFLFLNSY